MTTNSPPPYLTKNPAVAAANNPQANMTTDGKIVLNPSGASGGASTVSVIGASGLQQVSIDVILAEINNTRANNPNLYNRLAKLVEANGFTNFEDALEIAAFDTSSGQRSWEQFLGFRAENPVIKAEYLENQKRSGGGGAFSQTNTQKNLSSVSQAGAAMDNSFRAELGRTGTKDEAVAYQKALNEQQSKNPTVSRTSGYSDGSGNSQSNTTTTGTFDPTRFAQEYARSQEGYAERFAGVSFMKILDEAISNPNIIDRIVGEGIGG